MKSFRLPILAAAVALAATAAYAQSGTPSPQGQAPGANPPAAGAQGPCPMGGPGMMGGSGRHGTMGGPGMMGGSGRHGMMGGPGGHGMAGVQVHHHHYYGGHGRYERATMQRERWFGRMDTDGDGQVSLDELKAAQQAAQQRMLQMFERADTNRDGKVSPEEMRALRQTMRQEFRQKREQTPAPRGATQAAPGIAPTTSADPDDAIYHRG